MSYRQRQSVLQLQDLAAAVAIAAARYRNEPLVVAQLEAAVEYLNKAQALLLKSQ